MLINDLRAGQNPVLEWAVGEGAGDHSCEIEFRGQAFEVVDGETGGHVFYFGELVVAEDGGEGGGAEGGGGGEIVEEEMDAEGRALDGGRGLWECGTRE